MQLVRKRGDTAQFRPNLAFPGQITKGPPLPRWERGHDCRARIAPAILLHSRHPWRSDAGGRATQERLPRGEGEKHGELESPITSNPPEGGKQENETKVLARRASGSRPISRVLSWTAIHLGCTSPHTSCDLPGSRAGRTTLPYLVLLRVGFTLPPVLPPARCALTAPFHPYHTVAGVAVYFLWHFP